MRTPLAFVFSLLATVTTAAPVTTAKTAIRIGCATTHLRLPVDGLTDCNAFVAVLRGDVWTVSQKQAAGDLVGGGAPVVEISQETGEVLNFYLLN